MKRAFVWAMIVAVLGLVYWFADGRDRYYSGRAEEAMRRVEVACSAGNGVVYATEKVNAEAIFDELGGTAGLEFRNRLANRLKLVGCR